MDKRKIMNTKLMAIMIIGIVFISGCVQEQSQTETTTSSTTNTTLPGGEPTETQLPTQQQTISKYPPTNIKLFASAKEGEVIRFYFLLGDANRRNAVGDGYVKFEILNDLDNSLYYREFDVEASEFVNYYNDRTNQYMGKAYEWRVPVKAINKSVPSLNYGRAILTFITPTGERLSAEDTAVEIPTYSKKELEQMTEEESEKNSESILPEAESDNFKVKIINYEFFTSQSSFDRRPSVRVYFEVYAKKPGYFNIGDAEVVDSDGKLYNRGFNSMPVEGHFKEGDTKTGFLNFKSIFKNIPETKELSKIYIGDYIFDLKNKKGYTHKQLAEEEYLKNAVTINKKISKGNFEVTVLKAGIFSPYEWGKKKDYFRIDMKAKNIGNQKTGFPTNNFVLLDRYKNKYESMSDRTFDGYYFYPGITKRRMVLFKDVPTSATSVKFVFELNDENNNPQLFEYNIELK